jgi:hypothetical protein
MCRGQPLGKLESWSKKESGVEKSFVKVKHAESDNIARACFFVVVNHVSRSTAWKTRKLEQEKRVSIMCHFV